MKALFCFYFFEKIEEGKMANAFLEIKLV